MTASRGDVVIALFPHASGAPAKPQPVLVVQSDAYNAKIKNLIIAGMPPISNTPLTAPRS
jgi:mRNA-degrading endonuclease toxin of MazEF toxin-antitoxin module